MRRFLAPAAPALGVMFSQLAASGLGLITSVLIARSLGVSGRGEVAFLTSVAGLVSFLSTLSAHEFLANARGRDEEEMPNLLGTAAVLTAVLGACGGCLMWIGLNYVPGLKAEVDSRALALAIAAIPCIVATTYLSYLARAQHAHLVANVALVSIAVTNLTVNLLLQATGNLTARAAVGAWTMGQLAAICALMWHFRREFRNIRWPPLALIRKSLGFGLQAHLGGVMNTGTYQLDHWLVGSIAGPVALGQYSIAAGWFSFLLLVPTAVVLALRPRLVTSEPRLVRYEAGRAVQYSWVLTGAAVVVIYALAPSLTVGVFGDDFEDSIELLRVLSLGAFGVCALKIFSVALTSRDLPLWESIATSVGFLVALTLYFALIPRFGAQGAAWASVAAYTTAGIAAATVARQVLKRVQGTRSEGSWR